MKLVTKIIIILIFILAISSFNTTYANDFLNIVGGGDDFILASNETGNLGEDELKNASNMIYNILFVVGICVAVIISVILGIQFVMGSVEEKAKVQEQLMPFVVGCVVIFGAFSIWSIGVNIGNELSGTVSYTIKDGICFCDCGDILKAKEIKDKKCTNCNNKVNIGIETVTTYTKKIICKECENELDEFERFQYKKCTDCGADIVEEKEYFCNYCKDKLNNREMHSEKCYNCGFELKN